jgi:hypothetical protein
MTITMTMTVMMMMMMMTTVMIAVSYTLGGGRTCLVCRRSPNPNLSTPALFDTHVRPVVPCRRAGGANRQRGPKVQAFDAIQPPSTSTRNGWLAARIGHRSAAP